ncbi:MAG: glucokinase, partial [Longimicrobiales bacterium]
VHKRRYKSRDFPGLAAIIRTFLEEVDEAPQRACFGIACPIVDGTCHATNLSWTIDIRALANDIGIPRTELINDLHAVGHGVQRLGAEDLVSLQDGEPDAQGVIGIIGAGTGLGVAFATPDGDDYNVYASEGGHTSFSARTDLEYGLLGALAARFGHVSAERVVSGPGLVSIYEYLAAASEVAEQPAVRAEMQDADPAAVISGHALAGTDELSQQALDVFASAYGTQAGNLALTVMATGGIYVAGGIAPRIVPKLRDGSFMTAFLDKGRLSDVLAEVPVRIIVNPAAGLIGAATVAAQL